MGGRYLCRTMTSVEKRELTKSEDGDVVDFMKEIVISYFTGQYAERGAV